MNRILQAVVIVSAACVVLLLADLAASAAKKRGREFAVHYWEDPYHCVGCHWERYADWSSAQMSRAYTGDFFQAQYFQYALPDSKRDPKMKVVAADCIGCHSPTALLSDQIPPPPSRMKDNYWNRAWPWLDSFLALGQLKTGLQDERLEPLPDREVSQHHCCGKTQCRQRRLLRFLPLDRKYCRPATLQPQLHL